MASSSDPGPVGAIDRAGEASSVLVEGELVRLELPQIERPLSSREETDPEELFARFLFGG